MFVSCRKGLRLVKLAAAFLAAIALDRGMPTASADVVFGVTTIENLGNDGEYATSVNGSGQVAGTAGISTGASRATLTGGDGRGIADLGTLTGSGRSVGESVNSSGEVAGFSTVTGGYTHAFLTGGNGSGMRDLGTLGGTTSLGFAVNDSAQVTGYSTLTISGQVQTHAFLTGPGGSGMTDLGTLGSGTYSTGYAINASGQVTGYSYLSGAAGYYHAFLTMNGSMKDLGTLAGGTSSIGTSVNASGQVAGVSYAANGTFHAFLTEASGGAMHDLGTLATGGSSYARGVNDIGQAVGFATTASGATDAFVTNKGKMFDLNTLIPTGSGVHLTDAMAITDNGYIVAQGTDSSGLMESFLLDLTGVFPNDLTVIAEPSSLASMLVGLAVVGGVAARRRRRARAVPRPAGPDNPSSWDGCRIGS